MVSVGIASHERAHQGGWIDRSAATRNAVRFNGEHQALDRTGVAIRAWTGPSDARPSASRIPPSAAPGRASGRTRVHAHRCNAQRAESLGKPDIPIGTEHAFASAVRMRGASRHANGQEAGAWLDRALTLTAEIHSAPSRFRERISTPRHPPEPVTNPHEPLECAARRMLAESVETRAGQAPRAIGRQHSPFESTAFFVVARPGCPHPLPRVQPHSVTLTCLTHSVSSGFDARLSTTGIARRFAAGASAESIQASAHDAHPMPESPADSASGPALTIRIHSISSEREGRLSTSAL